MNVKILETGVVKTLRIIDRASGVNWVQDLIGNAGGFPDQFAWSEDEGVFLASQEVCDWWEQYIASTEATEREAAALADRLGMSVEDVMLAIADRQDGDYEEHRTAAVQAMEDLAASHAAARRWRRNRQEREMYQETQYEKDGIQYWMLKNAQTGKVWGPVTKAYALRTVTVQGKTILEYGPVDDPDTGWRIA